MRHLRPITFHNVGSTDTRLPRHLEVSFHSGFSLMGLTLVTDGEREQRHVMLLERKHALKLMMWIMRLLMTPVRS